MDDDEPQESDYPTVVVCSGELVEQVCTLISPTTFVLTDRLIPDISSSQLRQDNILVFASHLDICTAYCVGSGPLPCAYHPLGNVVS